MIGLSLSGMNLVILNFTRAQLVCKQRTKNVDSIVLYSQHIKNIARYTDLHILTGYVLRLGASIVCICCRVKNEALHCRNQLRRR